VEIIVQVLIIYLVCKNQVIIIKEGKKRIEFLMEEKVHVNDPG